MGINFKLIIIKNKSQLKIDHAITHTLLLVI